jgi:hypothetical protein
MKTKTIKYDKLAYIRPDEMSSMKKRNRIRIENEKPTACDQMKVTILSFETLSMRMNIKAIKYSRFICFIVIPCGHFTWHNYALCGKNSRIMIFFKNEWKEFLEKNSRKT